MILIQEVEDFDHYLKGFFTKWLLFFSGVAPRIRVITHDKNIDLMDLNLFLIGIHSD